MLEGLHERIEYGYYLHLHHISRFHDALVTEIPTPQARPDQRDAPYFSRLWTCSSPFTSFPMGRSIRWIGVIFGREPDNRAASSNAGQILSLQSPQVIVSVAFRLLAFINRKYCKDRFLEISSSHDPKDIADKLRIVSIWERR